MLEEWDGSVVIPNRLRSDGIKQRSIFVLLAVQANQIENCAGRFIHDRDGNAPGGGVSHVHQALG